MGTLWDGEGDLAAGDAGKVVLKARVSPGLALGLGEKWLTPKSHKFYRWERKEGGQTLQGS